MKKHLLLLFVLLFSISFSIHLTAQVKAPAKTESTLSKPYRVLTSGKRVTIQSKQNIKTIIVWAANGHRLIEQKDINSTSYTFDVTINEKFFFARVDMGDGKIYTEKLGIK